ncbi:MAG: dUTP diphosphatase [Armatimonadia bacterium]
MNAKELAALLNGREYAREITKDEEAQAKAAGLVVVFGASDDLMEFRGAIHDEVGAYDGGSALVDARGLLPNRADIDEDEQIADYMARKPLAFEIEAKWCAVPGSNISWTYQTEIPHETFEIVEDGEVYCRGIVFALADCRPATAPVENVLQLKVKKLHPDAIVPKYQSQGAACFDLHAFMDDDVCEEVYVDQPATIRTGLAFQIPEDHVMLVFSRSGHGFKNDIRLANCVGVIDSDYRGELQVKLTCDNMGALPRFAVNHGDRIAQAMVIPVQQVQFVEVADLTETERGTGGFGSTGA